MRAADIPILQRFTARLRQSNAAGRPSVPEATGDVHWNGDDRVLSLPNAAGTAWESYAMFFSGGAVSIANPVTTNTDIADGRDVLYTRKLYIAQGIKLKVSGYLLCL